MHRSRFLLNVINLYIKEIAQTLLLTFSVCLWTRGFCCNHCCFPNQLAS